MIIILSYGIKCGKKFLSFCHNSRVANAALHSMQRGKNGIQSYIDGLGVYNSCRPISSRKVQSSVAYVRFTTVNHHYFV